MSSSTISTRVTNGLYLEMVQFSLDNGCTPSDILKNALLSWREYSDGNVPEYLANKFAQEKADLVLKTEMRKILFLHNVQRKIKRLVMNEGIEGEAIKTVLIPLIEMYKRNAEVKQYEKAIEVLNNVLDSAKGVGDAQVYFMNWAGIVPVWKGK